MDDSLRYRIRLFQPGDLPRLQEITQMTFPEVSIDANMERILGSFGPGWVSRKIAAIAQDCELAPGSVFVAEDSSEGVMGYVTTRLDHAARIGWIPNLAVHPDHQGRGLGRKLLQHALNCFRESGMEAAKIETLEQNPIGQRLYPSLGFVEVARQIHYAMRLKGTETPEG